MCLSVGLSICPLITQQENLSIEGQLPISSIPIM